MTTQLHLSPQRIARSKASAPQGQKRWFDIRNEDDSDTTDVYIYDVIDDWFGVSAAMFAQELARVETANLTVHINSPGGDCWDGIAIMNAIRGHSAHTTTIVDGIAASAASFIAMAGDEIVMNHNSQMMIHDARGVAIGNSAEVAAFATFLDKMSDNIASIYAERTDSDAADWRTAMLAETWYSAEEAVDAGLADRVAESESSSTSKAAARYDLSIFNYAGRQAAPAPPTITSTGTQTPSATAEAGAKKKEDATMASLNEELAQRLGVEADAGEDTLLEALDEALSERATENGGAAPAEPTVQETQQAAAKHGLVVVDKAAFEALNTRIKEGETARAEQLAAGDKALLDRAVDTGRIAPASRAAWEAQLNADRAGITKVINELPAVIPVAEKGYNLATQDGANPGSELDAIYNSLFPQTQEA